nr:hypothetical protein [uncultured Noviherbaspirillum sp.]
MTNLPRLLFRFLALLLVLLLCGMAASALLGWTPGAKGLPADVASAYQPGIGN